ncbi:MAG: hypothetical protein OXT67_02315 [Zetaproteobacteria bacterium]|nr:hypothetical protein [Zetaproteobacteria bacterium]
MWKSVSQKIICKSILCLQSTALWIPTSLTYAGAGISKSAASSKAQLIRASEGSKAALTELGAGSQRVAQGSYEAVVNNPEAASQVSGAVSYAALGSLMLSQGDLFGGGLCFVTARVLLESTEFHFVSECLETEEDTTKPLKVFLEMLQQSEQVNPTTIVKYLPSETQVTRPQIAQLLHSERYASLQQRCPQLEQTLYEHFKL